MRKVLIIICLLIANLRLLAFSLKTVYIETVNKEEPTCDFIEAPEGSMGATIINATKVPCRIIIKQENDILYDSDEYNESMSGATIKIIGNTTAYFSPGENYPYKIKLQKKADLLLRADDKKYADKEWRLLKDAITLNTIVGLKVSELLGFPWTPAYTLCNVFINGDYRGCYLLIESVKRNADCRLNVDKETGYIIERDPYWWNEETYFTSDFFSINNAYKWTWKYPDQDKVNNEQEIYITQFINQAEQSIVNGNYEQYIDIRSFARWVLAHDLLGTRDSGGSNLYVQKYDNTDKTLLEMPCLWDFDSNFDIQAGEFCNIHKSGYDYYYQHLFNSNNKAFVTDYKRLWNEIKEIICDELCRFIAQYPNSDEGKALQQARNQHIERWNFWRKATVQEDAQIAINWFETHIPLLDQRISRLDETNNIISKTINKTETLYNLYGQKMTDMPKIHKGIYIKNNRKIIIK